MKKILLFCFICIYCKFVFSQQTIYISSKGDDSNKGTKLLPIYSLQKAFSIAREKKTSAVDIKIERGDYFLTESLLLDETYLRTPKNRIKVTGDVSQLPVFYGGRKIKPILDEKTGYWIVRTGNSQIKTTKTKQLLTINGKQRPISRFPDSGFIKLLDVRYSNGSFTIKIPSDLNELLKNLSEEEIRKIYATFYVRWTNIIRYIASYDSDNATLTFVGADFPEYYLIEKEKTFFKINNLQRKLLPGQWYNKDSETIIYNPLSSDNINSSIVVTPELDEFVKIIGTSSHKISNIDFENISLNTIGEALDDNGYYPYQAAAIIDAVIQISNANNINFTNINVQNVNTNVFWLKGGSSKISISKSRFYNLGAGAIKIGDINYQNNNATSNNIHVDNNIINNGGLIYSDGIPIVIFNAHSNTISHNDISNFYNTGISAGWVWGYGESGTYDNNISYNHIYNLGKGVSDDMGGVYTLGISKGTTIENNVIHDITSNNYGGWGVYMDEGSSGILIKNNLIYNCNSAGFHQHYGKDNILENNIFAYNDKIELEASRKENHNSLTFRNNIVIHRNKNFSNDLWKVINKKEQDNIFYSLQNENLSNEFSDNSKIKIINPNIFKEKYYYIIKNRKVFNLIYFKEVDFSKSGVYGTATWKDSIPFFDKR